VLDSDTVRAFKLGGLGVLEGQVMVAHHRLTGEEEAWARLIARYAGNSLALKLVGETTPEKVSGVSGLSKALAGSCVADCELNRVWVGCTFAAHARPLAGVPPGDIVSTLRAAGTATCGFLPISSRLVRGMVASSSPPMAAGVA
jgi:hypothetical protein